jgi:transcriptional regulator with XRE-family HTH domain
MPFNASRLIDLREVKGLSQGELAICAGLSQSMVAKIERGKSAPTGEVLDKLATALDCTMDYLYGRGDEYESAPKAAVQMAYQVYASSADATEAARERCRRAIAHADAPKTARLWHSLAQMIDMAIGPVPSNPAGLTVLKKSQEARERARTSG